MAEELEIFLRSRTEDRIRLVREGFQPSPTYFGSQGYKEYQELTKRLDISHLGVRGAKNVIFIPGVMGSLLHSESRGGIWWLDIRNLRRIDQLCLSPDGLEDAEASNEIAPTTLDPCYDPFLAALLNEEGLTHEIFAYDWRKPIIHSAMRFKDMVLRLYTENARRPIHLVAHSMGGLLVRAALMEHGDDIWPKVGRIIFIGTPHFGSPAIASYLKNHLWGFELMAVLGRYLSRDTFRSLWGVLSLLPAPLGIYPGTRFDDPEPWQTVNVESSYSHPCSNFDMYHVDFWRLELTSRQTSDLQRILDSTAAFHRRMLNAHLALSPERCAKMTVIAGVGIKTLFRLAYEPGFIGVWERTSKVTERQKGDPHREGDGRVPLASARLDKVNVRYVRGVHGALTNIPAVYRDVFRLLKGDSMELPATLYGALSSHLAGEDVSEAPHLDGTPVKLAGDDAGLWHIDNVEGHRLEALTASVEAGRLPEFTRLRIL